MSAVDEAGNPLPGNSGQSGTAMRVYSPLFEEFGVMAVFSGHSELFERSVVNGVHYYDTGVAGDGMRGPLSAEAAAINNPYNMWMAHRDEPELWLGNRLIAGGKHYGHLEVEVLPRGNGRFDVIFNPVHVFPVLDDAFNVVGTERRVYDDVVVQQVDLDPFVADPAVALAGRTDADIVLHSWTATPATVSAMVNGEAIAVEVDVEVAPDGDHFRQHIQLEELPAASDIELLIELDGRSRSLELRTARFFLSEPMLQDPAADSVRVVWYTEFEGSDHRLLYGAELANSVEATTVRMSRMFEDGRSELYIRGVDGQRARLYDGLVERGVWRHEAVANGLEPGVRVPYAVVSSDGSQTMMSATYSLQPEVPAGQPAMILLTSDQQNRRMSPATFQKVEETLGTVDLVLFAGDFVNTPHRASEWFDGQTLNTPPFFPSLQGFFHDLHPEATYAGGRILQHAPLLGVIGNHESPGRFALHAQGDDLNSVDNDPQPRWYAEIRYNREVAAGNIVPPADPEEAEAFKQQYIRDWSYEFTAFLEMWNHPEDGPQGEEYWARSYGDTFIIGMNVSRVWRNWNPGRGKFSEVSANLNNPDEWGFGDMFFEYYGVGSEQYQWLLEVLDSDAFKNAKYRIVMAHQTMFGLGDNSLPVMAHPVATIHYTDINGAEASMSKVWPADADTWQSDIEPLVERNAITAITYEYPLEADKWLNDIEPLLLQHGVHMVHTGHSHLWNRARVRGLNYIETSNYGNSFGAGYEGWADRAPWARFPGDANGVQGIDPTPYPRTGDAHGRLPIFPTLSNPMFDMEGSDSLLPFVASNNVGVFTVIDTADGMVKSYAFDTRDPDSEVVLFDAFALDATASAHDPFVADMPVHGTAWQWSDWMGWVASGHFPWVYTADHGWLYWHDAYAFGMDGQLFEDPVLGALFTTAELYPIMYSYAAAEWLAYEVGSGQPRRFTELSTGNAFVQP
jgi:hypothetical protein